MQYIKKAKQLVIVTDDKPGMLAEVSGALAGEKINLDAICAYGMEDKAIFYVICSDIQKAKTALAKKGWQVKEEDVIIAGMENKPGALSALAAKLKAKNINLVYCYGSACDCDETCACRFVFKAEDNDLAIAALQ
jgi:hypothetical protein